MTDLATLAADIARQADLAQQLARATGNNEAIQMARLVRTFAFDLECVVAAPLATFDSSRYSGL